MNIHMDQSINQSMGQLSKEKRNEKQQGRRQGGKKKHSKQLKRVTCKKNVQCLENQLQNTVLD